MIKFRKCVTVCLILLSNCVFGQSDLQIDAPDETVKDKKEVVKNSSDIVKQLLNSEWYLADDRYREPLEQLSNYAISKDIDSVLLNYNNISTDGDKMLYLFDRNPENIKDRSVIKGYVLESDIEANVKDIESWKAKYPADKIDVDEKQLELKNSAWASRGVKFVPLLSDSLAYYDYKNNLITDRYRNYILKEFSLAYGDSVTITTDSLKREFAVANIDGFNQMLISEAQRELKSEIQNSIQTQLVVEAIDSYKEMVANSNKILLRQYNDSVVSAANLEVQTAIKELVAHAEKDSVAMTVRNIKGNGLRFYTSNKPSNSAAMLFFHNQQNDSIGMVVRPIGKRELQLEINDLVTISRLSTVEQNNSVGDLYEKKSNIVEEKRVVEQSPWSSKGTFHIGFDQTYLSNWASGGSSSLSALMNVEYYHNYTTDTVTWENYVKFRYGAVKSDSENLIKNNDYLELNTKYGKSAFGKWFYSFNANFTSQVSNGYNNSDRDILIAEFFAPYYITSALGLDYKPNKTFSLFTSPLSLRMVTVGDTASIDQTRYNIAEDKKTLWEPGVSIKATKVSKISDNISMNNEVNVYSSYDNFLTSVGFKWDSTVDLKITEFIGAKVMLNMLYDPSVLFDTDRVDVDGNTIKKAKLQFKEYFSIGFDYRFR